MKMLIAVIGTGLLCTAASAWASSAGAVALSSTVGPLSADEPREGQRSITAEGMRLSWRIVAQRLECVAQAPTTGWVAVGFNTRPTLDGARLVMGRVAGGKVEVEVHVARPPAHHLRQPLDGKPLVTGVSGQEEKGVTRLVFSIPLSRIAPDDIDLVPGAATHVVLAYSREDDFQHHSAMRTAVNLEL